MKTNKLGIPIDNNHNYIAGHSIVKYKYFNRITYHYRVFRSNNPYIKNLYGIHIYKQHIIKIENK